MVGQLIAILILLLAWIAHSEAANMTIIGGSIPDAAGGGCGASAAQSEESNSNPLYWNAYNTTNYRASEFTYSGTTGTVCRLDLLIGKDGSPTGTLVVALYNDNGSDEVGTELTTCGNKDSAALETTAQWETFTCEAATLTNSTKYWIRQYKPSNNDGVNRLVWRYDASCATEKIGYSSTGASWTYDRTTECGTFKVYIND